MSVNCITENGGEVLFTKDRVLVMKYKQQIVEGRKQQNGLYMVSLKTTNESLITESKGGFCALSPVLLYKY